MADPTEEEAFDEDFPPVKTMHRRSAGLFNLIYRLLGRQSVSRHWHREKQPRLEFDFDELALCGVRMGQPLDRLSTMGLGPADESFAAGRRHLDYVDLGLELSAAENGAGIYQILLYWWEPIMQTHRSFPGRCVFRGQSLPLSFETTRAEIRETFGPPRSSTDEEEFHQDVFVSRGGEFSVIYNDDETLSFVLCSPTDEEVIARRFNG